MDVKWRFGLPAHPLLVHIPIVLIPLAALMSLGLWWEPFRRRFGWATVVVLGVAGVFTQLAIGSGQALEESLNERSTLLHAHTRIAEDVRPWLLLFFVALVAFMLIERRQRANGSTSMRSPLLISTLVGVVFAGISVYWVQRIGHSGAKSVWDAKSKEVTTAAEVGPAVGPRATATPTAANRHEREPRTARGGSIGATVLRWRSGKRSSTGRCSRWEATTAPGSVASPRQSRRPSPPVPISSPRPRPVRARASPTWRRP